MKDPEMDRVNLETVIRISTRKVKAHQKVSGLIETSKPLSPRKLARPLVGEILSSGRASFLGRPLVGEILSILT